MRAVSTPSQEPTPTGTAGASRGGAAPDLAKGGAAGGPTDPKATGTGAPGGPVQRTGASRGPRSPSQDRRVSIGLGIIVLGVVAALVFDLALSSSIPPLAASLIVLIIGVVGGAVLGRPSRTGKG